MIRSFLAAGLLTLGIGTVFAQNIDVIKERQQTMKKTGDASSEAVKMLRGQLPFDLAKAQADLTVFIDAAKKMPTLFPDDSKTGGDTHALPKIWEDKTAFLAIYHKLGKETASAKEAIKDEASFKATAPAIFKVCSSCHETYRKPYE